MPGLGFVLSAREGRGRILAKIQPVKKDPAGFDLVVIGTPNWDAKHVITVRTYLTENKAKFENVAFFLTQAHSGIFSLLLFHAVIHEILWYPTLRTLPNLKRSIRTTWRF